MNQLPPLIPGLADLPETASDCGCCDGIAGATPNLLYNRPGLPAVLYRPGNYAEFKKSQLARLSAEENPALARLKSREDDDFSIALIDAWSCTCDVLAFYQERSANEAWLGTALERESIIELGRLIGYRPRPGVAAATDLVFLMDNPPGTSAAVAAVDIPVGTRVQSVPGPGETAQTFETVEAISARVAWNALMPRQRHFLPPADGDTGVWLKGVTAGLKIGDLLLIVGIERFDDAASDRWDIRTITRVAPFPNSDRTRIEWNEPLDSVSGANALHLFTFRLRASLFGWNAPHPNLLADTTRGRYTFAANGDWNFAINEAGREIHLDAIQERFVAGGWAALTRPAPFAELYRIIAAVDDGRADYAVSARVTRLTLDTSDNLTTFEGAAYRTTSVYGGSEELGFAETPIVAPVQGEAIELDGLVEGLSEGHRLVVRGRRAQVQVVGTGLTLVAADDPALTKPLAPGMLVVMLARRAPILPAATTFVWHLRAPGGFQGFVTTADAAFIPVAAGDDVETIAEVATLKEAAPADDTHTLLTLDAALAAAFDRATTVIHANVAAATHGETTQEVLGNGNAARPFQSFQLKQAPLTHVSATNETGAASTLVLRIGDVQWHEAPALYGQERTAPVFETRGNEDGSTVVQFGDGITGARPPTGRNNIVATYRKGIGIAGSVAAGSLQTALDRPLGLRDVFNPLAAAGSQDPETIATARENAPITTLTLGRLVSLRNYADFARGFAGIAKARADTVWDGETRRIVVTVAGPSGQSIEPSQGDVFDNLLDKLRTLGDPFVRISLTSYRPATFRLAARLLIHPDHLEDVVFAAVEAALRDAYSFDRRGFAPLVASSDVIGVIHSVAGIEGVDLDILHRTSGAGSEPILHHRLLAEPVTLAPDGTVLAAEMLTLDSRPIALEAVS